MVAAPICAHHGGGPRLPVPWGHFRRAFKDGWPVGPPVDFLTGWLVRSRAWSRPGGVLTTSYGTLLVSDDTGGVIYRVTYTGS